MRCMVKNRNRMWMNSQRPRRQSLTQERCRWKQDLSHWDTFPSHISSGIQGCIKYYMPSYCTLHRWANTILSVTKEQKSSWVSSVSEQRHKYDLIVVMFPSASVSWAVHITSAALQCQAPNCTAHGLSLNEPLPPRTGQWNLCPHGHSKLALFIQNISEGFISSVLKWHYSLFERTDDAEILNLKHNCITAKYNVF